MVTSGIVAQSNGNDCGARRRERGRTGVRRAVILVCMAAAAAGCVRVPEVRPSYHLPDGMAGLFILNRGNRAVFNTKQPVTEGDKTLAEVEPKRYAFVVVAPGAHTLHCPGLSLTREVELDAKAGEIYYLAVEMVGTPQIQHCMLIHQSRNPRSDIFFDLLPQGTD